MVLVLSDTNTGPPRFSDPFLSFAEPRSCLSGIVSLAQDGEGWARSAVGKGACSQYVIRVIYTSQEHRPVYNGARLLDSRDYASLS